MAIKIARRKFVAALGGAAVAWPLAARAQKSAMPVLGFLGIASAKQNAPFTAWFVRGLNEAGYVEGQNVAIEYRWAEGRYDRLPELAADLVRRQVAVISASGGTHPLRAAMAATSAIPIIFSVAGDPVKQGIVSSMNRPGGNVTGVTFTTDPLGAKRLELVRELVPKGRLIALLVNPNSAGAQAEEQQLESVASSIAAQIFVVNASSATEIDVAFASATPSRRATDSS